LLTEATREIVISHWGNIVVDEYFNLFNSGAAIKGDYSRTAVDRSYHAQNCLRELESSMPVHIQGLSYYDFIGNISTSHAIRLEDEHRVSFEIAPRFPVCGQWKTDWHQGYNSPTKYHLYTKKDS